MIISEGTRVRNKLGISNGEVPGITLIVAERSKLGGGEGSGIVLSSGSCEGARNGNLEDVSEELRNQQFDIHCYQRVDRR